MIFWRYASLQRGWPSTSVTAPYFSMSHISLPFWRSLRSPSSRKTRRIAVVSSTAASTVAGTHTFMSIDSATRLVDM